MRQRTLAGFMLLVFGMLLGVAGCGGTSQSGTAAPAAGSNLGEVRFASWGGSFQEAQDRAWVRPFKETTGIATQSLGPTEYDKIIAMVQANKVEWDVVDVTSNWVYLGEKLGMLEPFDKSIVKLDGVPKENQTDYGVDCNSFSTVLGFSTLAFPPGGPQPTSWADFWDVAKFPGPRALYNSPVTTLEIALMADGVPMDQIYPITEEKFQRALAKLDQLKPHIVKWWSSGIEPVQALASNQVVMASVWANRVEVAKDEGDQIEYTWNQGILDYDSLVIPKGTPNKEAAMRFVEYAMSPEAQAAITKFSANGPVNEKAFDLIEPSVAQKLNTYPENKKVQLVTDARWWGLEGQEAYTERLQEWINTP